ncbi:MAG: ISNCY family transposase [Colwellia sp.]|nr:ISNCY family transposase [Colwellia sp.]
MRKRFEVQLKLDQTPIEKVVIPEKSRDELPPVIAALKWIFITPEINEQIFKLLEGRVSRDKKNTGRPGMDLWHILVLGIVRLALDCDYDRLEYLVHYDGLLRRIMGLDSSFSGEFGSGFHQKTISENVCHVDEYLLSQINEIIMKAGRPLFKKKSSEKIEAKVDSYVLESNVHFPTDLNLLWDACRKCIHIISKLFEDRNISGWRKAKYWRKQLKKLMRTCAKIHKSGGANKEERLKKAAKDFLQKAYELEEKVFHSINEIKSQCVEILDGLRISELQYFHEMLMKHIDLVERRLLNGEKIPHEEKVFSLFEPHTEWVNKGKVSPSIELGHKLLITTDQYGLILDYKVMQQTADSNETLALADRLLNCYGSGAINSISFDKGFSDEEDRKLLELYIEEVIMPKRGRLSKTDKERQNNKRFKQLRQKHNAVESDINCLEHHGLNRCPDKGLNGFKRYAGFGILAYNLHKIGNKLLEKQRRLKKAA